MVYEGPIVSCLAWSTPMISRHSRQMVGRQRELKLALDHYEAARDGHASVVLVAGEPGIGKTRLLDEIATRALQDGAVVLRGDASEAEGMSPYQPFLEALAPYIQAERLRAQDAGAPQKFTSFLQELAARLAGESSPSQRLSPEPSRFRHYQGRFGLYEAIGKALEAIGAPHAIVLILDNLHWADTGSLDLLCHIARRQSQAHLLILGAYRDSEIERNPVLSRTVAELSRQRTLKMLTVNPLSESDIEALAAAYLEAPLGPEASLLLCTQCEGNPFFAEELLDHWVEIGVLVQKKDKWVAVSPYNHTLPPNLVAVLRQRFARLPPDVIDLLRVAAIIGRTFDLSLLATVEEQEIEAVEERLLEAKLGDLIRANQPGSFTFSHDKIRECLYAEVSTARRQRLHGAIGRTLEARYKSEQTINVYRLAELAFYFARSGDRVRGADYSLSAASQAMQTFAAEEAISHYQTALELLSPEDSRYGDVLLGLAEAHLLAGKNKEAEAAYDTAQQWLAQNGSQEAAALAAHGLGRALWQQEKRSEAHAALLHALELLGERQCAATVEVLLDLSVLLTIFTRQYAEGAAYGQQALALARSLGDKRLEVMASRIVAGNLSAQVTDLPAAPQFLQQTLAQAERNGDLSEAAECSLYLAGVYYWLAEIRRSFDASAHMLELIKRSRQLYLARNGYSWQVLLFASQGRWAEAEQMIELALPVVDSLTSPLPLAFLCQMRGFLAYQREDYHRAESEFQAAMVSQDQWNSLGEAMFYFGLLGLTQAILGKREDAYADMARLEKLLETLPVGTAPTAPIIICLALAALTLDDQMQARRLYSDLLAFQGQHYWFLVDRVLGMIAALDGEWETATIYLTAAEATARREDLQPELARTLLGLADVEVRQGGQGSSMRARRLLDQALDLFTRLNMAASVRYTHSRLRSLSGRPTDSPLPSLPANLTQHEAVVLKLVAQGKSNREIAQALNRSQKTIDNQLTTIFFKTKTENRTAATAFAIRHGLA
jgi:predicted ATPase/DNA-binding CsgD family transcriptional regulator